MRGDAGRCGEMRGELGRPRTCEMVAAFSLSIARVVPSTTHRLAVPAATAAGSSGGTTMVLNRTCWLCRSA